MSKIYKDQIPPESGRKYRIEDNSDGTASITDVTEYQQEGTPWAAIDANDTMFKSDYDPSDQGINITTQLYTCAKIGTVFSLSGKGSNIKFVADASFEDGDTFAVNGTEVTAQTQDGEPLSGGYFVSGSVVSCFLNGTVLNFKLGGGNMLNFHVVGGTEQPALPKENTIWVKTETAITDWMFAPAKPAIRSDGTPLSGGEIWILTVQNSANQLNCLKKNAIIVRIMACYQYTGSGFSPKEAYLYQEGIWNTVTALYVVNGVSYIGTPYLTSGLGDYTDASATSSCMVFSGTAKNVEMQFKFPTLVDVTHLSTIKADIQIGTAGLNGAYTVSCGSASVGRSGTYPNDGYDTNRRTLSLDVSNQSGLQSIGIYFAANFQAVSYAQFNVYNITGEVT